MNRLPVRSVASYQLGPLASGRRSIRSRFERATRDRSSAGSPEFRLEGRSESGFAETLGLPIDGELSAVLDERTDASAVGRRVELDLVWRLVAATGLDGPIPPRRAPAAELDTLLADLDAAESGRRLDASARLADLEPDPAHRESAADRLVILLADPDAATRRAAARALVGWATPASVPGLVDRVEAEPDADARRSAIVALARLADRRAAGPLARRLADPGDRGAAATALRAIGPAARRSVARLLTHPEADARLAAAWVLADIGMADLTEPLRIAGGDPDPRVAAAARDALRAVERRRSSDLESTNLPAEARGR